MTTVMFDMESNLSLSRRARRKQELRRAIEAAALGLFAERGIERTTVEEVTERADVAKGTFFNYYSSKHDVLAQRLRELARSFVGFAEEPGPDEPVARLVAFFGRAETLFAAEGPALNRLYAGVFARPELAAIDAEVEEHVLAFYRGVLAQGCSAGLLRPDLDLDLAARMIVDIWSATLRSWMTGACASLGEALERKLELLFRGFEASATPAR